MGLDWGNVPAWVGAVLTSTSVGVAAITLRSNAQRAIRSQARQVHLLSDITFDAHDDQILSLQVVNNSEDPIYSVQITSYADSDTDSKYDHSTAILNAGESTTPIVHRYPHDADVKAYAWFWDADAYTWLREDIGALAPALRADRAKLLQKFAPPLARRWITRSWRPAWRRFPPTPPPLV